ncbi:hypothetical protein KKG52_03750 [Patescibacteria group bacterium]|nr:hypothetical protein [Patescibacteria group bacterium]
MAGIAERIKPQVEQEKFADYQHQVNFDRSLRFGLAADSVDLEAKKEKIDEFIGKQVETLLGERFHVELSSLTMNIRGGRLVGEHLNEPLLDSFKKGRDFRRLHGKEIDFKREDAEVIGFEKIEKKLTAPEAKPGTMVLSVSPRGDRGSEYQHNFYDIFTLKEDKAVEVRRYSSSLSPLETARRLNEMFLEGTVPFPSDVSFLSNPILTEEGGGLSADSLHKKLHEKHDFMEKEDFDFIFPLVRPMIVSYLEALTEENLKAILNHADDIWEELKKAKGKGKGKVVFLKYAYQEITAAMVRELGKRDVRQVMTGCGSSGSLLNRLTSFRVSEYGVGLTNSEKFVCPKCHESPDNSGPVGDQCPKCGITKEEFAAETGEQMCE